MARTGSGRSPATGRRTCADSAGARSPRARRSPCCAGRRPSRCPRTASPRDHTTYWPSGSGSTSTPQARFDATPSSAAVCELGGGRGRESVATTSSPRVAAQAATASATRAGAPPPGCPCAPQADDDAVGRHEVEQAAGAQQGLGERAVLVEHGGGEPGQGGPDPQARWVSSSSARSTRRSDSVEPRNSAAARVAYGGGVRTAVVVAGDEAPEPVVAQRARSTSRPGHPCSSGTRCGSARRCAAWSR